MDQLNREPLHRQIAAALRREIGSHIKPGQKLASQNELAERFQVGVLTVREALSALAEEGLIEKRKGSGTYATGNTRRAHVGVLIEADISHPSTSPFFVRVIQRVRHHLRDAEQRSILYAGYQPPAETWNGQLSCPEFWESLEQGVLSGVVCLSTRSDSRWLSRVLARGVPVVGDDPGFGCRVVLDHDDLISQGVGYLVAQGCRRLAHIGWGNAALFDALLKRHGLEQRPEWNCCDINPSAESGGWRQFRRLWPARSEKPDGLLVSNDLLFSTAKTAISELGISVPRDLRIVTHSNKGLSAPGLFPVAQLEMDPDAYALQLAQMMLDLLARREPASKQATAKAVLIPEHQCAMLA